jgi:hypothetical protein
MAATDTVYFANMGTITVAGAGGTPASKTLALVKDVEATVKWEHAKAMGWGTIQRAGVAKYNQSVEVKIGYIKFAPKVGEWFPFYIGDSSAGAGSITDTNAVTLFTVTAQFVPLDSSGTVKLLRTISGVFFNSFPLKASENQWVKVDLAGEGITTVDTNPA